MSTNLDVMRQQLIEVASTRPDDIANFYAKNLAYADGCTFLLSDAPRQMPLLFRGKLRHFDASLVPFVLAGVDPNGEKKCGVANCINPAHVI